MEQYLLTQEDIDRLGITGVMAGEPASIEEMKLLGLPVGPSQQTAIPPDVPVAQQVTGTTQPATNTGVEAMLAQGAQAKPVASMTQEEDPYSALSKTQRRMLAFAAISDAGAALQGKQGRAVRDLMGDFTARADQQRKAKAAQMRVQALQQMTKLTTPAAVGGDMIAQLEAQRQALLQQAFLYPDLAPSIKLSIDNLNTEIERLRQEEFTSQDTAMGASTVLNTVSDLSEAVKGNPNITGPVGMILGVLPFTEAGEARLNIETLRANLAFDTLRNIKAGGATLGSVSAPELALLEAKVANLNLNRSPEAVLKSLEEIDRYYKQLVINAYNRVDDPSKLDAIFGGRPAWAGGETADLPSYTPENVPLGELVTYVDEETGKQVVVEYLGGPRDKASSWKEVNY